MPTKWSEVMETCYVVAEVFPPRIFDGRLPSVERRSRYFDSLRREYDKSVRS